MSNSTAPEPVAIDISAIIGYLEIVQRSGILTFKDAYLVYSALQLLSTPEAERNPDLPFTKHAASKGITNEVEAATALLVQALALGQQKGAFSLTDASRLAQLLGVGTLEEPAPSASPSDSA
jgi:hypothetical protein